MDHSLPGSSIHGIFQARVLEWVANAFSVSDYIFSSYDPIPHLWDSPGKNTGVGCHFLLQCMKVKSESEIAQLCLTPYMTT